jgi:hypothetical protein
MSKKDSKINDDISNLMAEGVDQSTATSTALDKSRKPKKKHKRVDNGNFYEEPWKVEKDTGRVSSGRALLQKKPKMRHGAY